ncbi:hypothetical protein ABZ178_31190 [Streptomyces massasporeus]|uniref:hypothetical protein n=1 Tax=Streptomyces massasporeus TaxID=67324 RepID=UPI0033A07D89
MTDRGTANEGLWKGDLCQNERDWPEALALLGLPVPVPVSVVGVALFTIGGLSMRMSAHAEAMRDLDKIADEREARSARSD